MYLLVTNKSVINKAQNEADNLLQKFCGQRQSTPNKNLTERKKSLLIHNQVSSYAAALPQSTSQTLSQSIIYSPPSYKRPISISFTPEATYTNKTWTLPPSKFPHHLNLIPHRFLLLQHKNVKFKLNHYPSSQQPQLIHQNTNSQHHRGKMNSKN